MTGAAKNFETSGVIVLTTESRVLAPPGKGTITRTVCPLGQLDCALALKLKEANTVSAPAKKILCLLFNIKSPV
jgi:hypothetical protein